MAESGTVEPKSLHALRQFFEENKDKYQEIWVIITNKKTANPQIVSFNQVISEAKNHGLIDSRIKKLIIAGL